MTPLLLIATLINAFIAGFNLAATVANFSLWRSTKRMLKRLEEMRKEMID